MAHTRTHARLAHVLPHSRHALTLLLSLSRSLALSLSPSLSLCEQPSFESIEEDVMMIRGMHIPIRARPGRHVHAVEYADELQEKRYGVVLARPERGAPMKVRELLTPEQQENETEIVLHDAWRMEPHELILGAFTPHAHTHSLSRACTQQQQQTEGCSADRLIRGTRAFGRRIRVHPGPGGRLRACVHTAARACVSHAHHTNAAPMPHP